MLWLTCVTLCLHSIAAESSYLFSVCVICRRKACVCWTHLSGFSCSKWVLDWIDGKSAVFPGSTCPASVIRYGVITKALGSFADPALLSIIETFYHLFIKFESVRRGSLRTAVHQHYSLDMDTAFPAWAGVYLDHHHQRDSFFYIYIWSMLGLRGQTCGLFTARSLTVWWLLHTPKQNPHCQFDNALQCNYLSSKQW